MSILKIATLSLISLVILGFVGCGSQKRVVVAEPKTLPSWYTTPPQSNRVDLYAIGDGKNKQEAITNALAQMVSTLSVSIASTYSAKTVVKEGRVSSSEGVYTSDTQSEIAKIRISNYELLKAESLGFKKYAVLVKSNKAKLFESMLQEIEQNFSLIAEKEQAIQKTDALKQLSFYRDSKESLSSLPNRLLVMNALQNDFDATPYLSKMQTINTKYLKLLESISFSIHTNTNANNLKAPLAKGLSAKKFKLKNGVGLKHFSVKVTSKIERASSYGFTLARNTIVIVTVDDKGAVVGSNTLNIVGQSSQGYEIAKQNVAVKLNALIAKDGIGKIMGLDI